MFDHYHRIGPSQVHHTSTLHEHRAPTDDSIRLLNEMEAKTRANLVATFATSNNTLQATWAEYRDPQTDIHQFLCKLVLNGKPHDIRLKLNALDAETPHEKVDVLYRKLCDVLAAELMAPLLKEMHGRL